MTLYTKSCCPLCDTALDVISKVQREVPFQLHQVDIESDPELFERYRNLIPVLIFEDQVLFYGKVSAHRLKEILRSAQQAEGGTPLLSGRYRAFLRRLRSMLDGAKAPLDD